MLLTDTLVVGVKFGRFGHVGPGALRTSASGSEIAPTVVTSQTTIVAAIQDAPP